MQIQHDLVLITMSSYRFADMIRSALRDVYCAYQQATGQSKSAIGLRFAGDTSFFGRLDTHRPNTRKADIILQKFSDAWPSNATWPVSVPRPPVGEWADLSQNEAA